MRHLYQNTVPSALLSVSTLRTFQNRARKPGRSGMYWSGCAGSAKWGLELCGITAIDLGNHTAMNLESVQTLPQKGEK